MNKSALLLLAAWIVTGPVTAQPQFQILRGNQSYLGVQIRDITDEDVEELQLAREAGVYVVGINPDSPAQRADLRSEDVILKYATQPVWSVTQFKRLVSETPAGRKVELTVLRNGQAIQLEAVVEIGGRSSGIFEDQPTIPGFKHGAPPGLDFEWEQRSPQRARLGVRGEELTPQMAEAMGVPSKQGVLVMEVLEDSAAEKGGLRAGDVITAVDGQPVRALSDIAERLKPEVVTLEIVRDKEVMTVEVDLAPQKPDRPGRLRL